MGPRDHRIHLGRMDSLKTPPQNHSSTKQLFSGPFCGSKKAPRPKCRPGGPKSDPGLQNLPLGMKIQKMRAEKPCRIQPSELQTEPYGASYGPKPSPNQNLKIWGSFWVPNLKIWGSFWVPFWRLIGPWRRHFSPKWAPLENVWGCFVNRY